MNNTVKYNTYSVLSRVQGHVGDLILYKHCTSLYYSCLTIEQLVGSVFSALLEGEQLLLTFQQSSSCSPVSTS